MGFGELFLIAMGLSMDALAVSICKGLSVQRLQWKHMLLARRLFWWLSDANAQFRVFVRATV